MKSGLFKACKIFVTASLTENQPMTLLEAQANGLVAVAINKRGMVDLIKNNHNGYLVKENDKQEFADKIVKLINSKSIYKKMKKNTLKEIQKHSLKYIGKEWEKEYSSLIKSKQI
jgi:glycosyltransferase involved in cell wall biosynthesis